ncbi:transmembrane transporter, partial [Streptomyces pristinaespiralis ATCC 25486]
MTVHDTTMLLIELGAILLGLGLTGRFAGLFGLSPVPLYLLVGLAFGSGGLLPLSASGDFVAVGADIGVILLLLMLGLEYSASELVDSLRTQYPSGAVDFVLNALPGAGAALLLGWSPVGAVALAGVTWISSSGVIAKVLADLGRLGNRETPVVLGVLVIEDLSMALYLPLLTALLAGLGLGRRGPRAPDLARHGRRRALRGPASRPAGQPGRLLRQPRDAAARRARPHPAGRGRRPGAPGLRRGRRLLGRHRAVGGGRGGGAEDPGAAAGPVRGGVLRLLRPVHRPERDPARPP